MNSFNSFETERAIRDLRLAHLIAEADADRMADELRAARRAAQIAAPAFGRASSSTSTGFRQALGRSIVRVGLRIAAEGSTEQLRPAGHR